MEYLMITVDEDTAEFIETIGGVVSLEEYDPTDEIKYYIDVAKRTQINADKRVAEYKEDYDKVSEELIKAREEPKNVPVTPDYVDFLKLKKRNEELVFWESMINEIKKDIDLKKYFIKLGGL